MIRSYNPKGSTILKQLVGQASPKLLIGAANITFTKLVAVAFRKRLWADIKSGPVRIRPAQTAV